MPHRNDAYWIDLPGDIVVKMKKKMARAFVCCAVADSPLAG